MICPQCGKVVPDDSKFCKYCGETLKKAEKTAPKQEPPKQNAPKKKGNILVTLLIAAVVFLGVKYFVSEVIYRDPKTKTEESVIEAESKEDKQDVQTEEVTTEASEEESAKDSEATGTDEYWESTFYGALVQNGKLTYGPMSINVDAGELQSEDDADYLWTADRLSVFYVNKQLDVLVDYDNSDADSMLKSYTDKGTQAEMMEFEKFKLGSYRCIFYAIKQSSDDGSGDTYAAELIAFQPEDNVWSVRILAEGLDEEAFRIVVQNMKAVEMSDHPVSYEDTGSMGITRIAVK